MATETGNKVDSDQEAAFRKKIDQIKKDLGVDSQEHMLDFAMSVGPLGSEKAATEVIKQTAKKATELAEHLPEALKAAKAALPQTVQDALPMSARDLVHLMFLPQNASPVRMAKSKELRTENDLARHAKMQMATIPYGWATIGGFSAYAAHKVVEYKDSPERHYEQYAKRFLDTATQEYKQHENLIELKEAIPGLSKPIDTFLGMQEKLAKDGELSKQDKAALNLVAEQFSNIIKTDGPESPKLDSSQNTQLQPH